MTTEATTATKTATTTPPADPIVDAVRARYAAAARNVLDRGSFVDGASCCAPDGSVVFGELLYGAADRASLPDSAVLASLGCGNPTAVADLREGETVLDLGSGGGIDVLLSAQRVGPTGFAYGLDMTDEMLELARRNAATAGVINVEFFMGRMEAIPLPDASVDVVISNCVVNLSTNKAAVLAQVARVLRPGGRLGISFSGCIASALSFSEYRAGLSAVGLEGIRITSTHAVADGLHGAIIQATKPLDWTADRIRAVDLPRPLAAPSATALPVVAESGCCGGSGCC